MKLGALMTLPWLALALAAACDTPEKGELARPVATRATLASFRAAGVSTVFERRCGSLDCHGAIGRNLRIYSGRGLRLPNEAGLGVGTGDTTADEVAANYQTILTLEPEETNRMLEGGDPGRLLVMRKPLAVEKHEGGQVLRQGDDAERCISSWLAEDLLAPVDREACARAAVFPKE